MYILISMLHIVFCLALILIVLLQTGKGSDLASAFGGGGSNTVFGSAGAASFLNRITTFAALFFMVTSLALAILSGRTADDVDLGLPEPLEAAAPADRPGASDEAAVPAEGEAVEPAQPPVTANQAPPAGEAVTGAVELPQAPPVAAGAPQGDQPPAERLPDGAE